MSDIIHNVYFYTAVAGGAEALLDKIRIVALANGWVVDQFDTGAVITTETGGYELYLRTQLAGMSSQDSFSLKAFNGQNADQTGIYVFLNTGYASNKRVDNQPGMFARTNNDIVNAASWTQIFAGTWDAGANGNPADRGQYLTSPFGTGPGPVPLLATNVPHLNLWRTTVIDKLWIFTDQVSVGGCRTITVIWYIGNQMYALSIGKVHYDNEGIAPDNVDGSLLALWHNKFDDRATNLLPANNALGGSRNSATATNAPIAVIRQRTNGGVVFPAGAPNGTPLIQAGTTVKSNDHIEASDGQSAANKSAVIRPEQSFDAVYANLSDAAFPNPKLSIHRETFGTQHRQGVARGRALSRYPNGGALTGIDGLGGGVVDWSDARYYLPWYFVCTLGSSEGAIINTATKQFMVFPGNRGGVDAFASHRRAGIGFRIA